MMHVTASNLRCNYALTVTHAFGLMWSSGALWHVQLDFKLIYVKNYVGVPLGKALCDTLKQIWNGKNNKLYKQLKVCFHLTDIHILVFFCTRESSACTLSSLKVKFSYLIVTNSFCTASKVSCAAISGHLQFHANKHRICPPMLWKLKFLLRTKNGAGQMFETFIQMDVLALFMRVCDDFTQWGHELLVGCFFSFFFFFFKLRLRRYYGSTMSTDAWRHRYALARPSSSSERRTVLIKDAICSLHLRSGMLFSCSAGCWIHLNGAP